MTQNVPLIYKKKKGIFSLNYVVLFVIFMYKLLTLIILGALSGNVMAQTGGSIKVTGAVIDSASTNAVPYAIVILLKDQKKVATTATDTSGKFELKNILSGKYTAELSSVGYKVKSVSVSVTQDKGEQNIGVFALSLQKGAIGAVTVTSQKALIEDKGDRLVYNAEKDISNAGGTAADVLRKVPSLTVDLDGNVQMRGNSNIKVLINGKPSAMMARNLADALKQMPANSIKSIEVITSPGAKYDAEGSAGVINIITKKGLQGFNGSVNAAAGNFNRSVGTSLNFKKNKIGVTLSANAYQYRNKFENNMVRTTILNGQPLNILNQNNNADNTGTGGYGELSFDYDIDSTSRINLAMNVWGGNFPNNSTMFYSLTDLSGTPLQAFKNESRFRNPYGNGQLDLGYTKTFKKPYQEFSLLGQFSRMPDNYRSETDRFIEDKISYRQQSTNDSRNKEYTIQADYTHPFTIKMKRDTVSLKLEVGSKAILREIGSEYRLLQSLDGNVPFIEDPGQSNDFKYKQQVFSGYTSLRMETQKKWSLNMGGRLEQTHIDGRFMTTGTLVNNKYNNFIPSVTLSKGIKKHNIKVSYTQRITRPMIWVLNPWVNINDPKNIQTGNPYLNPELSHAVELVHSVSTAKGTSINTSLYYRGTNNAIEYLQTVNDDGVSLIKPQNIGVRKAYGVNVNISGKPAKNLDLNGGADIRYVDLSSPSTNQSNNGIVWNTNLNSTYKIGKNYTIQANGSFGSGWISLQGTNSGFYWYGFSGKRTFIKEKASISLTASNPFNKGIYQTGKQSGSTFTSESNSFYYNRQVRVSFEWKFGQMSAGGKQSKRITNDDTGK